LFCISFLPPNPKSLPNSTNQAKFPSSFSVYPANYGNLDYFTNTELLEWRHSHALCATEGPNWQTREKKSGFPWHELWVECAVNAF
jgi:hypothetical protein